jgi:hypothetical protein
MKNGIMAEPAPETWTSMTSFRGFLHGAVLPGRRGDCGGRP